LWQESKKTVAGSHGKVLGLFGDCYGMNEQGKRSADSIVCFGSCQLDVKNVQVWRDHQEVKLTGKAFAVLCYFVQHPGQLVTKDDLFAAAWPETVVSDATLASCIQEIRQALGDEAKRPRYIETVHRRGFRFIATLTHTPPVVSRQLSVVSQTEAEREKPQTEIETEKADNPFLNGGGLQTEGAAISEILPIPPCGKGGDPSAPFGKGGRA
jgi:DNA-binding winged helix-turn-helix (wHTH) protein